MKTKLVIGLIVMIVLISGCKEDNLDNTPTTNDKDNDSWGRCYYSDDNYKDTSIIYFDYPIDIELLKDNNLIKAETIDGKIAPNYICDNYDPLKTYNFSYSLILKSHLDDTICVEYERLTSDNIDIQELGESMARTIAPSDYSLYSNRKVDCYKPSTTESLSRDYKLIIFPSIDNNLTQTIKISLWGKNEKDSISK